VSLKTGSRSPVRKFDVMLANAGIENKRRGFRIRSGITVSEIP
jgi:hypothetical protein